MRTNDPRSDLFFVGVILYNMLAGVSPIGESRDRTARLSASRYQNIKPVTVSRSDGADPAGSVRLVGLGAQPRKRHASAQEMHDDAKRILARLEAGDLAELNTPEPVAPVVEPCSRR